MNVKAVWGSLTVIGAIAFTGWAANEKFNEKVDRFELAESQLEQEVRVYDVLIEEAEDEYYDIKYKDKPLTSREERQLEVLDNRIEKYKTRQERLYDKNS